MIDGKEIMDNIVLAKVNLETIEYLLDKNGEISEDYLKNKITRAKRNVDTIFNLVSEVEE